MAANAIEMKLVFSSSGVGAVTAALGSLSSRIEALARMSEQISARIDGRGLSLINHFVQQKNALQATTKALADNQAETTRLGRALAEAKLQQSTSTAALSQAFEQQRSAGKQLKASLLEQTRALQTLRGEMAQAGINTRQLSEERGRLRRMLEQEQQTLDRLATRYQRLSAVQKDVSKYKKEFGERKDQAVAAVGVAEKLLAPVVVSARFEDKIRQISLRGGQANAPAVEQNLASKVRAAAVGNGVSHDQVASGVERLVQNGLSVSQASNYANLLAKVSKASRVDATEVANLIGTLQDKFKLKSEGEIAEAIDVLAKAGKLGQGEISALGQSFEALGDSAAALGSWGVAGVKDFSALMQTLSPGGGTAEANTYLRDGLAQLGSSATQAQFKRAGIDFEKAKQQKVLAGKGQTSGVEAGLSVFDDYIDKVLVKSGKRNSVADVKSELTTALEQGKKNGLQGEALGQYVQAAVQRLGLSSVLQNPQATQAYLALSQGSAKFREARQSFDAPDVKGTIDRDFAAQNRLVTAQWERLKVSFTDLGITVGNVLLPVVGRLLGGLASVVESFNNLAQRWPGVTKALVSVVAVVGSLVAAFLGLRTASSLVKLGLAGAKGLPLLGRVFGNPGGLAGGTAARSVGNSAARAAGGVLSKLGGAVGAGAQAASGIGSRLLRPLRPLASGAGRLFRPLAIAGSLFEVGSTLLSNSSRTTKGAAIGGAAGGLAGGLAGAKLGALLGTAVLPGVGTVLGGVLGGALGGFAGDKLGRLLGGRAGQAVEKSTRNGLPALPRNGVLVTANDRKAAPVEIKLDYQPKVTIYGDPTPQTLQKFGDLLRAHQQTLEEMLRRSMAGQQRRAF